MVPSLSSKEFALMQKFIEEQCGISIREEKAYLIESRLSKLLIDSGLSSFEELYRKICLNDDPAMVEKVVDAITTNETMWFRDKILWQTFEEYLLPQYIQALREGKKSKIHIWSAACSSGQEPYSIAMLIDRYLTSNHIHDITLSHFKILATDISKTVLKVASLGRYDSISIMRGLDNVYKDTYFSNEGRIFILKDHIRNAIRFEHFNLQKNFLPLGNFDIVFCRYVIIYFSEKLKTHIMDKIASVLKPKGLLFVGSSELATGYKKNFHMEHYKTGVYYRRKEEIA